MRRLLKNSFVFLLPALLLVVGGVSSCSKQNGYFSKQLPSVEDPQTDDERTLIGEYNDFLLFVDSLAEVWNGTDTLAMRRLYYNQREQRDRIRKVAKYQNVRRSLADRIEDNIDVVIKGIYDKFSPELCSELYWFHHCFDLNKITVYPSNAVDNTVYTNSYGEHYCLVRDVIYKYVGKNDWPERIECVIKHPLKDDEINSFKEMQKRSRSIIYTPPSAKYTDVEIIEIDENESD